MTRILLPVLASTIASGAFGIIFHIRGKNIFFAALSGGVGYLVYLLCLPLNAVTACFLASAAISIYAEFMARRRKAPSTLFLVAGMLPIVPGSGMYNCTLQALEGDLNLAAVTCYSTLLQAGAIAIGIIAVSSIVKLIPRNSS